MSIVALSFLLGGCNLVLGLGDFKEGPGSGGGGGATSSSEASTSSSTNSSTTTVSGTGGTGGMPEPAMLVAVTTMQDYGSIVVNQGGPKQMLEFRNAGGTATQPIHVQLKGNDIGQFAITSDGCNGAVVDPGMSCFETVAFNPTQTGPLSATLELTESSGDTAVTELSGAGILAGMIGISPTMWDFMNVDVGSQSASQDFVVNNTGGQSTGVLTTSFNDPGNDFQITDGCNNQQLAPMTGTCTISVIFKPGSYGAKQLVMTVSGMPGGTVTAQPKGFGMDYFPLSVQKSGAGNGLITSAPSGINCGGVCMGAFPHGSMVTLTAVANMGSTFNGWSGGGCSGTGTCTVTMNSGQTVTADFSLQNVTLTVTKNFVGAATGAVVSTSPNPLINCGPTCTQTYPYGTVVSLAAQPGSGFYLQGWTGGITSTAYTPTVTLNGNTTVTATFTPANIVFVSSMSYTGNIGGLAAANLECNNEASMNGIAGNYVAWLSTSTVDAGSSTHLNNARGWVRKDGLPFGDSEASIVGPPGSGHVWYPPRLNAAGTDVGGSYYIATGTSGGNHQSGFMCGDWTSASGNALEGLADAGILGWSYSFSTTCNATFHLLCMQTDYQAVTRVLAPGNGRVIFTSSGIFSASAGASGADMICANEASGANLPGTYHALLAKNGQTAAASFSAHNLPLMRTDGVIVSLSDSAFLAGGGIRAPLEVGANGQHLDGPNGRAFTGAVDVKTAGTAATTCNNWGTNAASSTGKSGLPNLSAGTTFFNDTIFAQPNCDYSTAHVYCMQD